MGKTDKQYIGDGVYLAFAGYGFTMTTENGIEATNTIVLEPEVVAAFIAIGTRMILMAGGNNATLRGYGLPEIPKGEA